MRILPICVLAIFLSSCSSANDDIPGKFIWVGIHSTSRADLILREGSKTKILGQGYREAVLSPDGNQIAAITIKEKVYSLALLAIDGTTSHSFEMNYPPHDLAWVNGKIYYVVPQGDGTHSTIYAYDPLSGAETELMQADAEFNILDFAISPDESRVAYYVMSDDAKQRVLYVRTIAGALVRRVSNDASNPIWLENGKKLAYFTTRDESGQIVSKSGLIFSYDLESGKKTLIERRTFHSMYTKLKLSKDEKYFYASGPAQKGGGLVICFWPVGQPDKLIQVSAPPHKIDPRRWSLDLNPDWYQGN